MNAAERIEKAGTAHDAGRQLMRDARRVSPELAERVAYVVDQANINVRDTRNDYSREGRLAEWNGPLAFYVFKASAATLANEEHWTVRNWFARRGIKL